MVAVAAINVNVSFVRGKTPNVSLKQARALANGENPEPPHDPCAISATTLLVMSSYKMALTNSSLNGGIAIRNNTTAGTAAYGLDVEQGVRSSRSSTAVRAHALSATQTTGSQAYGVNAVAGNAANNYGVYAGLKGCGNGAALFATTNATLSHVVSGKYAGYFQGPVYASSMNIGGINSSYSLYVAGSAQIAGQVFTLSDERHKSNIKKLGGALDIVGKLRPVTYNFKPDDVSKLRALAPDSVKVESESVLRSYLGLGKARNIKKKHVGFVAQELQKVFPELVHSDTEGTLSVDYISLVPILAGAIQEQSKTIQEQNKTIQGQSRTIEQQNETIERMNEAIERLSERLEALENSSGKTTAEGDKASIEGSQGVKIGQGAESQEVRNFSFSMFPNPTSNGSIVTIDYTMHVDAAISIDLHNQMGQLVRQLLPKQRRQVGSYSVQTPISGLNVGVYVVRMVSGNHVESKQLLVK
jgi:uncharacterized coiled-coil protein SlyX